MSASKNNSSKHKLEFSSENFDDYLTALLSKIRDDDNADSILSDTLHHPLIDYQRRNNLALRLLRVPRLSPADLLADPVDTYKRFVDATTTALNNSTGSVPDLPQLDLLDDDFEIFKAAERWIYTSIVKTLRVGLTMHYARGVPYGAGQALLNRIREDNRHMTTRSLMALFGALFGLRLKPEETFETYSRRLDLLVQRLANWRPPVVLPEALLLYCALRGLPDAPFGPVRHIILASPSITFREGISMLRDVDQSGATLIKSTLGSGSAAPTSVLFSNSSASPPAVLRQVNNSVTSIGVSVFWRCW